MIPLDENNPPQEPITFYCTSKNLIFHSPYKRYQYSIGEDKNKYIIEPYHSSSLVNSITPYVITEPAKERCAIIKKSIMSNIPILIDGITSSSKTSTVEFFCATHQLPLIRFNFSPSTTLEELLGQITLIQKKGEQKIVFIKGPFSQAFIYGKVLLLDEISLASESIIQSLMSYLDNQELTLDEIGQRRTYKMHPQFRIICTQNPAGSTYKRTKLNNSVREHFRCYDNRQFPEISAEELENIITELFGNKRNIQSLLQYHIKQFQLSPSDIAKQNTMNYAREYTLRDCIRVNQLINAHVPFNRAMELVYSLPPKERANPQYIYYSKSPLVKLYYNELYDRMRILMENGYHVLIASNDCHEAIKYADAVLSSITSDKREYYGHICCSSTLSNEQLIGSYVIQKQEDALQWIDSPLLRAMKQGGKCLFHSLQYISKNYIERLNSVLEVNLIDGNQHIIRFDECSENPLVNVHQNFRLIATISTNSLKDFSPALLNRFILINLDDCIIEEDKATNESSRFVEPLKQNDKTPLHIDPDDLQYVDELEQPLEYYISSDFRTLSYFRQLEIQNMIEFLNNHKQPSMLRDVCLYQMSKEKGSHPIPQFSTILIHQGIAQEIFLSLTLNRSLAITGPKNCGKSYIIQSIQSLCNLYKVSYFSLTKETEYSELMGYYTSDGAFHDGRLLRDINEGNLVIIDHAENMSDDIFQQFQYFLDPLNKTFIYNGVEKKIHEAFRMVLLFTSSTSKSNDSIPSYVAQFKLQEYKAEEKEVIYQHYYQEMNKKHVIHQYDNNVFQFLSGLLDLPLSFVIRCIHIQSEFSYDIPLLYILALYQVDEQLITKLDKKFPYLRILQFLQSPVRVSRNETSNIQQLKPSIPAYLYEPFELLPKDRVISYYTLMKGNITLFVPVYTEDPIDDFQWKKEGVFRLLLSYNLFPQLIVSSYDYRTQLMKFVYPDYNTLELSRSLEISHIIGYTTLTNEQDLSSIIAYFQSINPYILNTTNYSAKWINKLNDMKKNQENYFFAPGQLINYILQDKPILLENLNLVSDSVFIRLSVFFNYSQHSILYEDPTDVIHNIISKKPIIIGSVNSESLLHIKNSSLFFLVPCQPMTSEELQRSFPNTYVDGKSYSVLKASSQICSAFKYMNDSVLFIEYCLSDQNDRDQLMMSLSNNPRGYSKHIISFLSNHQSECTVYDFGKHYINDPQYNAEKSIIQYIDPDLLFSSLFSDEVLVLLQRTLLSDKDDSLIDYHSNLFPVQTSIQMLICLILGYLSRIPVVLEGDPGIGKSENAVKFFKQLNIPYYSKSFASNLTLQDLFGSFVLDGNENFIFHESELTQHLKNDKTCALIFDELNLASPDVLDLLCSLVKASMSDSKQFIIPGENEPFTLGNIYFVITLNPATMSSSKSALPSSLLCSSLYFKDIHFSQSELLFISCEYLQTIEDQKQRNCNNQDRLISITSNKLIDINSDEFRQELKQLFDMSFKIALQARIPFTLRDILKVMDICCSSNLDIRASLWLIFCCKFYDKEKYEMNQTMGISDSNPIQIRWKENKLHLSSSWNVVIRTKVRNSIRLTSSERILFYKLALAISSNRSIIVYGPSPSGKSYTIRTFAEQMQQKLLCVHLDVESNVSVLVGHYETVEENDTIVNYRYRDGALIEAIENGYWLLVEDAQLASGDILERLNSLCQENSSFTHDENNSTVYRRNPDASRNEKKIHDNFRLFFTVSDTSISVIPPPLLSRCIVLSSDSLNTQQSIQEYGKMKLSNVHSVDYRNCLHYTNFGLDESTSFRQAKRCIDIGTVEAYRDEYNKKPKKNEDLADSFNEVSNYCQQLINILQKQHGTNPASKDDCSAVIQLLLNIQNLSIEDSFTRNQSEILREKIPYFRYSICCYGLYMIYDILTTYGNENRAFITKNCKYYKEFRLWANLSYYNFHYHQSSADQKEMSSRNPNLYMLLPDSIPKCSMKDFKNYDLHDIIMVALIMNKVDELHDIEVIEKHFQFVQYTIDAIMQIKDEDKWRKVIYIVITLSKMLQAFYDPSDFKEYDDIEVLQEEIQSMNNRIDQLKKLIEDAKETRDFYDFEYINQEISQFEERKREFDDLLDILSRAKGEERQYYYENRLCLERVEEINPAARKYISNLINNKECRNDIVNNISNVESNSKCINYSNIPCESTRNYVMLSHFVVDLRKATNEKEYMSCYLAYITILDLIHLKYERLCREPGCIANYLDCLTAYVEYYMNEYASKAPFDVKTLSIIQNKDLYVHKFNDPSVMKSVIDTLLNLQLVSRDTCVDIMNRIESKTSSRRASYGSNYTFNSINYNKSVSSFIDKIGEKRIDENDLKLLCSLPRISIDSVPIANGEIYPSQCIARDLKIIRESKDPKPIDRFIWKSRLPYEQKVILLCPCYQQPLSKVIYDIYQYANNMAKNNQKILNRLSNLDSINEIVNVADEIILMIREEKRAVVEKEIDKVNWEIGNFKQRMNDTLEKIYDEEGKFKNMIQDYIEKNNNEYRKQQDEAQRSYSYDPAYSKENAMNSLSMMLYYQSCNYLFENLKKFNKEKDITIESVKDELVSFDFQEFSSPLSIKVAFIHIKKTTREVEFSLVLDEQMTQQQIHISPSRITLLVKQAEKYMIKDYSDTHHLIVYPLPLSPYKISLLLNTEGCYVDYKYVPITSEMFDIQTKMNAQPRSRMYYYLFQTMVNLTKEKNIRYTFADKRLTVNTEELVKAVETSEIPFDRSKDPFECHQDSLNLFIYKIHDGKSAFDYFELKDQKKILCLPFYIPHRSASISSVPIRVEPLEMQSSSRFSIIESVANLVSSIFHFSNTSNRNKVKKFIDIDAIYDISKSSYGNFDQIHWKAREIEPSRLKKQEEKYSGLINKYIKSQNDVKNKETEKQRIVHRLKAIDSQYKTASEKIFIPIDIKPGHSRPVEKELKNCIVVINDSPKGIYYPKGGMFKLPPLNTIKKEKCITIPIINPKNISVSIKKDKYPDLSLDVANDHITLILPYAPGSDQYHTVLKVTIGRQKIALNFAFNVILASSYFETSVPCYIHYNKQALICKNPSVVITDDKKKEKFSVNMKRKDKNSYPTFGKFKRTIYMNPNLPARTKAYTRFTYNEKQEIIPFMYNSSEVNNDIYINDDNFDVQNFVQSFFSKEIDTYCDSFLQIIIYLSYQGEKDPKVLQGIEHLISQKNQYFDSISQLLKDNYLNISYPSLEWKSDNIYEGNQDNYNGENEQGDIPDEEQPMQSESEPESEPEAQDKIRVVYDIETESDSDDEDDDRRVIIGKRLPSSQPEKRKKTNLTIDILQNAETSEVLMSEDMANKLNGASKDKKEKPDRIEPKEENIMERASKLIQQNVKDILNLFNEMSLNGYFDFIKDRINKDEYTKLEMKSSHLIVYDQPQCDDLKMKKDVSDFYLSIKELLKYLYIRITSQAPDQFKSKNFINYVTIIIDLNLSHKLKKARMRSVIASLLILLCSEVGIQSRVVCSGARYQGFLISNYEESLYEKIAKVFALETVRKTPSTPMDLFALHKEMPVDDQHTYFLISDCFSEQLLTQLDPIRQTMKRYSRRLAIFYLFGQEDEQLSKEYQDFITAHLQPNFENVIEIHRLLDVLQCIENKHIGLFFSNKNIEIDRSKQDVSLVNIDQNDEKCDFLSDDYIYSTPSTVCYFTSFGSILRSTKNGWSYSDYSNIEDSGIIVSHFINNELSHINSVSVKDVDMDYYVPSGNLGLYNVLNQTIPSSILFNALNTTLLVPNKAFSWCSSITGTTIDIPNFIKHKFTKSGNYKIFKERKGNKKRDYTISIIIDGSISGFNEINHSHSYLTIFVLLRALSEMSLTSIDLWIATDKVTKVCSGITSEEIWSRATVTSIMKTLQRPVASTVLPSTIIYGLSTLSTRSKASLMFVLTNGTREPMKKLIRDSLQIYPCTIIGVGIGTVLQDYQNIYPKFIWSRDPNRIRDAILNLHRDIKCNPAQSNIRELERLNSNSMKVVKSNYYGPLVERIYNEYGIYELRAMYFNVNKTSDACINNISSESNDSSDDLGKDGAFTEYSILFVILYLHRTNDPKYKDTDKEITMDVFMKGMPDQRNPKSQTSPYIKLHDQKGFNVEFAYDYRTAYKKITSGKFTLVAVTCSSGDGQLSELAEPDKEADEHLKKFLNVLHYFNTHGGTLIWFLENFPFSYEAELYYKIFYNIDQLVSNVRIEGGHSMTRDKTSKNGVKAGHYISIGGDMIADNADERLDTGVYHIYEGKTLACVNEKELGKIGFQVFARESEGHAAILVRNERENEGRCIIDTAMSKLFLEFTSDGTSRMISNYFTWGCNIGKELRFENCSQYVIRNNKIDFTRFSADSIKRIGDLTLTRPRLETGFCVSIIVDSTGTMSPIRDAILNQISIIFNKIENIQKQHDKMDDEFVCQVVGYRDFYEIEGINHFDCSGVLADMNQLKTFVSNLVIEGGGTFSGCHEYCEDVQGGLTEACKVIEEYPQYKHIALLISDQPNHGVIEGCKFMKENPETKETWEDAWNRITGSLRNNDVDLYCIPIASSENGRIDDVMTTFIQLEDLYEKAHIYYKDCKDDFSNLFDNIITADYRKHLGITD